MVLSQFQKKEMNVPDINRFQSLNILVIILYLDSLNILTLSRLNY